jgi:hypothetical protein
MTNDEAMRKLFPPEVVDEAKRVAIESRPKPSKKSMQ